MNDHHEVLAKLTANGIAVSRLTDEQQQVLSELTKEELSLLLDIKARFDDAEADVTGHAEMAGGSLF